MKHAWWYQAGPALFGLIQPQRSAIPLPNRPDQFFFFRFYSNLSSRCKTGSHLSLCHGGTQRGENKTGRDRAGKTKKKKGKHGCFPTSLSDGMAAAELVMSLSSDANLTVFVLKIRLSALPAELLQMQIPSAEVFYGTCSCFPGQPCQTSTEDLQIKMENKGWADR